MVNEALERRYIIEKERIGWMILAEESAKKLWDNEEDEIWNEL